jgi:hypothetical protein
MATPVRRAGTGRRQQHIRLDAHLPAEDAHAEVVEALRVLACDQDGEPGDDAGHEPANTEEEQADGVRDHVYDPQAHRELVARESSQVDMEPGRVFGIAEGRVFVPEERHVGHRAHFPPQVEGAQVSQALGMLVREEDREPRNHGADAGDRTQDSGVQRAAEVPEVCLVEDRTEADETANQQRMGNRKDDPESNRQLVPRVGRRVDFDAYGIG